MTRLIDADALYVFFLKMHQSGNTCTPQDVLNAITNAPTVQREHKYCGRKIDLAYGSTNCGSDFHGSIMKCDDCASEPTVQREGWVSVPIEVLNKIKTLPRYNFLSPREGGVRRWENRSGDWIERYEVIKLIDDYIQAASAK